MISRASFAREASFASAARNKRKERQTPQEEARKLEYLVGVVCGRGNRFRSGLGLG